jgi:hypothetical protein
MPHSPAMMSTPLPTSTRGLKAEACPIMD